MTNLLRKALTELVGTFLLVFFAVGSAVFGIDRVGVVGVALACGLVLLALAYALGPVSGCHVNPAVTLGVLIRGGVSPQEAVAYWIAQFLGGHRGRRDAQADDLEFRQGPGPDRRPGHQRLGRDHRGGGAFVLEIVLTFLLVFVVLLVTGRAAAPGFAGLAIGLVLTVIHLVGIPLDGTSVNPARSFGPAVFSGTHAMAHVWLFIVAPLIGGIIAAVVAPFFGTAAGVEDTTTRDLDPTGAAPG